MEKKKITVKPYTPSSKISLLVSQSEFRRGEWKEFADQFDITPMGGCAYKMSRIARGDADGTFTLSPKSEWDICAGKLIVEEAGGLVARLDGSDLQFNQDIPRFDGLIYCNSKVVLSRILESI